MIINEKNGSDYLKRITESIRASRYSRIPYEYDFNKSMAMLEAIGKGFNPAFKLEGEYFELYKKLLMYFMADPEFKGDLQRGLMLRGTLGSGKTLAFAIFQKFMQYNGMAHYTSSNIPEQGNCSYRMIRCMDIKAFYEDTQPGKGGEPAVHEFKFSRNIICFDDLGEETKGGKEKAFYYGHETNLMEDILTARYELFLKFGTITHCTTNYSFDLEGKRHFRTLYGDRVEDRMKEMFNEIIFKSESKRVRL